MKQASQNTTEGLRAQLVARIEQNRLEAASASAPACMAEGQKCAQCGAPAWRVHGLFFCLDHDAQTLELDREIKIRATEERRRHRGEQAFQVEHYLALWKSDPSADNWARVLDAAVAYSPDEWQSKEDAKALVARGRRLYFVGISCGRPYLGRYTRVGRQGKLYGQSFRKGSKSWTKER